MSRSIWLDEHCESPLPPGARLIDSEVDFLRYILGSDPLFIQGPSLCRWARTLADARGWTCTEVGRPSRELLHACPMLSEEQAEELVGRLGDRLWKLDRPLRAIEVANTLWPDDIWLVSPGWSHAARWLCWLIDHDLSATESVLVTRVAELWQREDGGLLGRCYSATNREQALALLEQWLGLVRASDYAPWEPFPLGHLPPSAVAAIAQRVRREIINSNGEIVSQWYERGMNPQVRRLVAREAMVHYQAHPRDLRPELIHLMAPYLSMTEVEQLRVLCPPEDPGLPPHDIADLLVWYRERYLPWRVSIMRTQDAAGLDRARAIGRGFGEWYLREYPRMVMAPPDENPLSWARVAQLRRRQSDEVTLLVVPDGLGVRDLPDLLREINAQTTRLTLEINDIALAPVPSVTEFAKTALLRGLPPDQALVDETATSRTGRLKAVVAAILQARPGAVVIWRLVEPDRTYHQTRDWYELSPEVQSKLGSIASQLQLVVADVRDEIRLRIVITTDHGRLLGLSQRSLQVPPGCQAHGRAAWGKIERSFPKEGFVLEENVAVLAASAYDLPNDANYVVALSDQSFQTNDGRGGEEWFPHGGVYPEEVLVPWVELVRDAVVLPLEVAVTGRGEAGKSGQITLDVMNPNEFPITLVRLDLQFDGDRRGILADIKVGPRSRQRAELKHGAWPSPEVAASAAAWLIYRLPSDVDRWVPVEHVQFESEALYEKKNILEGLEP